MNLKRVKNRKKNEIEVPYICRRNEKNGDKKCNKASNLTVLMRYSIGLFTQQFWRGDSLGLSRDPRDHSACQYVALFHNAVIHKKRMEKNQEFKPYYKLFDIWMDQKACDFTNLREKYSYKRQEIFHQCLGKLE